MISTYETLLPHRIRNLTHYSYSLNSRKSRTRIASTSIELSGLHISEPKPLNIVPPSVSSKSATTGSTKVRFKSFLNQTVGLIHYLSSRRAQRWTLRSIIEIKDLRDETGGVNLDFIHIGHLRILLTWDYVLRNASRTQRAPHRN